jgi:putative Holliday junction resolvase
MSGRALAIDYGTKRTGIAVTDELQLIASGLTTVATADLLEFLIDYTKKEQVAVIVVGKPLQMDSTESESEPEILSFIKKLNEALPHFPVVRIDERFTSKMAQRSLLETGARIKHRRNKALIDEISATLILQNYLNQRDSNS